MNVQNTEAWNVFIERSEQGVSAVPASLAVGPPTGAVRLEMNPFISDFVEI